MKILLFFFLIYFNISAYAATLSLESGSLNIDNSENTATCHNFRQTYSQPPVVYAMMDDSGNNNAIIKITSVTTTQFCAKVMETIFEDGPHVNVPAYYVAIPQGVYRLPDGTKVEAGVRDISNVVNDDRIANSWTTLNFSHAYSQPPSVITQLQTLNNELAAGTPVSTTKRGATNNAISIPWVTETINNITSSSAQIALDKSHIIEENLYITKAEKVGYFVIESNKFGSFTATDTGTNPVYYQTFLTGNVFGGYDQSCQSITINNAFPNSNYLFIASKAINNPSYGGWFRKCAETNRQIGLLIDSKRENGSGKIAGTRWQQVGSPNYGLSTRNHPAAPASIAVFSRSFDLTRQVNDANLSVTASVAPLITIPNGSLIIDLNISNKGPESAPNTVASLSLPSGMIFQQITSGSANWSCVQVANAVDCSLTSGDLAANASSLLSLKFSAPSIQQNYSVSISAASDGLDDDGASTSVGFDVFAPVANYRLDECSWSGSSYDVLDSSGNNLHGIAINNPPKAEAKVCKGGQFNGASTNTNVTVENNALLNLANELTISVWVNPSAWPTSDLRTILSKDTNYEFHLNTNGRVNWWWGNGSFTGSSAVPLNTWTHIALTYKSGEQKIYINGVQDGSATYTETLPQNTLPMYIGVDYNYPSRTFNGLIDEVKIFNKALSQSAVSNIYSNELSLKNYDGTARTCTTCTVTPDPTFAFDAWDTFRPLSDRNISTKIVNKSFDLNISSLDSTKTALQDFNGTVCSKIVDNAGNALSGWNKSLFNTPKSASTSFTINRAIGGSDSAGVKLYWKKNVDSVCPIVSEDNTTMASDRFAIRPLSFTLPSASGIAGVDFNITFSAPNFTGAASADFNESAGGSFEVSVAEHNPLCTVGTFTPTPSSFSFINGTKIFTTRYSEVGVLDVNITDLTKACGAKYANIDCDDADVAGFYASATDLPIGLTQAQITVKPHHFDVTGTFSNFAGGSFTYLSDDLNMSAALDLNITAKNGENNTTANYSSACYAKNTDLTLVHSSVPNPLTKILYTETLSALNTYVLKADPWVLSLNSSLFNSGSVAPNIDLNFDRSPSKPLNPFDFNITSATATDADAVSGTGTPLGDATFVYGRVRAYDVTTNEASAPNPIEFEVYSTTPSGFVSGMPQNVLKWYRNLNHDTAAEGNVIRGGFSAGATDSAIDTSAAPADGLQMLTVTSVHDQTIHLDITPWLWYSPNYTYDYSGNCTRHPCFNYDYTDVAGGVKGVNSGTFQGSDFQMTPAKNITNKGVKLFR